MEQVCFKFLSLRQPVNVRSGDIDSVELGGALHAERASVEIETTKPEGAFQFTDCKTRKVEYLRPSAIVRPR